MTSDESSGFREGQRAAIGERARLGRWFRRLAETIFPKVRESETLSPTPEKGVLPGLTRSAHSTECWDLIIITR